MSDKELARQLKRERTISAKESFGGVKAVQRIRILCERHLDQIIVALEASPTEQVQNTSNGETEGPGGGR